MDPDNGGAASAVGDVGTHAFHLLRYITGLEATRMSAELSTLVPGRRVFDNATMRLTLSNGAPATVWATMAATGHEHGLRIRVFGDDASLEWRHEDPQHLIVRDPGGGATILAHGMSTLSDDAARLTRVGLGHPEGFLEAFANFYSDLADILRWAALAANRPSPPASTASSVSGSLKRPSPRTPTTQPGSPFRSSGIDRRVWALRLTSARMLRARPPTLDLVEVVATFDGLLQDGGQVIQRLGHDRVEHDRRHRHRLARAGGAELEPVAGEGEWAGAVAVTRVCRQVREGVDSDDHGALAFDDVAATC